MKNTTNLSSWTTFYYILRWKKQIIKGSCDSIHFFAPFSLNSFNGWSERSEMKEAWIQWKERGAKWMEQETLLILLTREQHEPDEWTPIFGLFRSFLI